MKIVAYLNIARLPADIIRDIEFKNITGGVGEHQLR
jgi:hypothetical protein